MAGLQGAARTVQYYRILRDTKSSMKKIIFLVWMLALAGCAPGTPTPQPALTATALATITVPAPLDTASPLTQATDTPAATPQIAGPFSSISHSTDAFHLGCDPLSVIFDVTTSDPHAVIVTFFFRLKDKASGMTNSWSKGEDMHTPGNGNFELILNATAFSADVRFNGDAWLQYQLVALDRSRQVIGRSQIFDEQITFTPACP